MPEQSPPLMRKSLHEAILWCGRHDLLSTPPETPEFRRRWTLIERASRLFRGSEYKSERYQEASRLMAESDPDTLVPLKDQLRSPELSPSVAIGEIYLPESTQYIVDEVVSKRAALVAAERFEPRNFKQAIGRILIYQPEENVADGASSLSSHGFFDMNDAPPWDTWVSYSNHELICWVPEDLVSLAQKGIDANAVDCIYWAHPRLLKQLM